MASEKREEPSLMHHLRHLIHEATKGTKVSLLLFAALAAGAAGEGAPGENSLPLPGTQPVPEMNIDAYSSIMKLVVQSHEENQTFDEVISIIRSASGLQTLSFAAAKAVLKHLIEKYAQQVLSNLIDDMEDKAIEVVEDRIKKAAHSFAQILSNPQETDTTSESDSASLNFDALSPEVIRAISNIADELQRRSQTDPNVPLELGTLFAFQLPAPGAVEALSNLYDPVSTEKAEYVASVMRLVVTLEALKGFQVDTQVQALAQIVDTPIRVSTVQGLVPLVSLVPSVNEHEDVINQLNHLLRETPWTADDVVNAMLGGSPPRD